MDDSEDEVENEDEESGEVTTRAEEDENISVVTVHDSSGVDVIGVVEEETWVDSAGGMERKEDVLNEEDKEEVLDSVTTG